MIIIVPLGGIGKRFTDLGYNDPKPLIRVLGKEIIFYLLDSLKINKNDKVYIVYNKNLEKFSFEQQLSKYPEINFFKLNRQTSGPVETIYRLTRILVKDKKENKLLILDGDTFYKINILKKIDVNYHSIFYHRTKVKDPIFSYINIHNNKVTQIAEKKKLSNNANTGAYFFKDIEKFNQIAKEKLKINKKVYVSEIYEELINQNEKVIAIKLSDKDFSCLGTPKQVIDYSLKNKIKQKRFCFDLDNTLVTNPTIKNDYMSVRPILKNIKFLNFLYSKGHYIIIHTARRMRTHSGNIKNVEKEIKNLTIEQLKLFKINYHELIFGKPYAHFYIDDLSINPYENLHNKLGFYENDDYLSREFNKIIIGDKFTIKYSKNSTKLKSEINYLKTIPRKIKFLFPSLLESSENFYKMNTVHGLKLSYLLLNNLLTKEDLTKLFQNLRIIHDHKIKEKGIKINIYDNYSTKLRSRIKYLKKYDPEKFKILLSKLEEYESKNKGKIGIIHGDPVFSNIIKKSDNKFVFLDPRGLIRNKFSIYGDLNYDYAKIYQSLNGYENIIHNKKIDKDYLEDLKKHFEKMLIDLNLIDDVKSLKFLTASLYYSLCKFHSDKYHKNFLSIADNLI